MFLSLDFLVEYTIIFDVLYFLSFVFISPHAITISLDFISRSFPFIFPDFTIFSAPGFRLPSNAIESFDYRCKLHLITLFDSLHNDDLFHIPTRSLATVILKIRCRIFKASSLWFSDVSNTVLIFVEIPTTPTLDALTFHYLRDFSLTSHTHSYLWFLSQ